MSDSPNGSSASTENTAGVSGVVSLAALDLEHFQSGGRWRGRYLIGEQLPDITYGKVMRAADSVAGGEVLIRSFRVADQGRARAWERLKSARGGRFVEAVEALEAEGRRLEVTAVPNAVSLRAWASGRTWGLAEIRTLVAQLHEAVSGLHALELVHLNLNPENILVSRAPEETISLGGLEAVTEITGGGMVAVTVDPFSAPPETAGLFQQNRGPSLKAWDWWSVGRVIQEVLLGQPVLGLALGRDVTRRTPELLTRAEQFLRETAGSTSRPGGVELMPRMDPAIVTLLRGLLSSSRDARWGTHDVAAWLRGEQVKERYHLAFNERLFVWNERAYAVDEAAALFTGAAHWREGRSQILDAHVPGSLAHFLGQEGATRKLLNRVEDLARLPETAAFAGLSPEAAREVVAAVALTHLANGSVPFRIRGERLDGPCLARLLGPEMQAEGLALVEVLLERTLIQQIAQTTDAEAARMLGELSRRFDAALALATPHHWISRGDRGAVTRLLRILVCSADALAAEVAKGHKLYAVTRDEAMNALFQRENQDVAETAVLVFALQNPGKFGFVPHDVWVAEQHRTLHEAGERVATAATWCYLARALRAGPHLVGPLPLFLVYWSAVGAFLALAFPSRVTLAAGLGVAVLGWLLRTWVVRRARRDLRARLGDAPAKQRLPSSARCREAAREALPDRGSASVTDLSRELAAINRKLHELPGSAARALVAPPDRFSGLLVASVLSVVVTLTLLGLLGRKIYVNPPTWPVLKMAWLTPPPDSVDRTTKPADALSERRDEGKPAEDSSAPVKVTWPYRLPPHAPQPRVSAVVEASAVQAAAAEKEAQRVLEQYDAASVQGLLAVQVQTESAHGFMLYDGKTGKLADRRVYLLPYLPLARAWMMLGERPAIYLGGR